MMKIGDIVWLKSGSPPMTVVNINVHVLTYWFDADGKRHEATYHPDVLMVEAPAHTEWMSRINVHTSRYVIKDLDHEDYPGG